MAQAAYRHILRSARLAFQGDIPTLTAARLQTRQRFESQRNLEGEAIKEQIAYAEEVAKVLRENVVQGEALEQGDRYKLRIHEHTERGNNTSIKTAGKNTLAGVGCCSV